jgi:hypothetical protein
LLGHIPGGQYDAVLIDEAHDFEPEWLSLAVKMVNPNTKAFMIAYDDMQAIYKGRRRPVWSQLGIEAKGRTRVLKVNYGNTVQILGLARRIAEDAVGAPGVTADENSRAFLCSGRESTCVAGSQSRGRDRGQRVRRLGSFGVHHLDGAGIRDIDAKSADALQRCRRAGIYTICATTTPEEAKALANTGVDGARRPERLWDL